MGAKSMPSHPDRVRRNYDSGSLVLIHVTADERDAWIREITEPEDTPIDVEALVNLASQMLLKELDRK